MLPCGVAVVSPLHLRQNAQAHHDARDLAESMSAGDNGPPAHPLGVPGNGSASPARHSGARASFGQHREVVKMATASSFLAHMEVQSGFVVRQPPPFLEPAARAPVHWQRGCVSAAFCDQTWAALETRFPLSYPAATPPPEYLTLPSGRWQAKRRRGVLSMPTGRKDTKGHSSEEETYNIIGVPLFLVRVRVLSVLGARAQGGDDTVDFSNHFTHSTH